jgi:hypothetical protein
LLEVPPDAIPSTGESFDLVTARQASSHTQTDPGASK